MKVYFTEMSRKEAKRTKDSVVVYDRDGRKQYGRITNRPLDGTSRFIEVKRNGNDYEEI